MAEPLTAFVTRRRPDWDALRALLDRHRAGTLALADLGVLDRLYRRASADLARAQASYPGTDADRFLNQLCAAAYAAIYQAPRDRGAALVGFFAREFPAAVRAELRYIGLSAAFLLLGIVLGAVLVLGNPEAARLVVPQHLRDAIADHRMWTDDLVSVAPNALSSGIATNNLTVTVMAFASGITLGLGTTYLMVSNGLLLGAVGALCVREGMGYALFSFIGGHGPVEMSVITIAGGAGLILGHALIEPGDRPRAAHLKRRAREAVKLVLGCAPFLALIALIEGFVSPGNTFPGWLKISAGLALGSCLWGYLLLAGRQGPAATTDESASLTRRSRWPTMRS